jgi:hypothetical protein
VFVLTSKDLTKEGVMERAMGIEPNAVSPQVIEDTHQFSPIWAQVGAEFRLLCPSFASASPAQRVACGLPLPFQAPLSVACPFCFSPSVFLTAQNRRVSCCRELRPAANGATIHALALQGLKLAQPRRNALVEASRKILDCQIARDESAALRAPV